MNLSSPSLTRHPARTVVGSLLVAGFALWCSRSTLDVAGSADAQYRVAVFASWPDLVGAVVLMFLVASSVSLALQGSSDRSIPERSLTWHPIVTDALRPLFVLAVLALPYLPWLPDWLPALRVLAGPLKWLLWVVVLGQVVWVLLPHLAERWWPATRRAVGHRTAVAAIFLASLGAFAFTSHQLTGLRVPSGDEPHYLVMAQSLLYDHDLRIENNHERRDYRQYFPRSLRPDYRTRGTDGEIYSIHPIGLAFLIAPVFAVAGYPGVVWLLMLLSAATVTLMWRWALALTGSVGAATFAWAAVALSTSWVFTSVTVFPEIPGAFCVMLVLGGLRPNPATGGDGGGTRLVWPAVIAVAALPWLHSKYAAMALVLAAVMVWHHRRPAQVAAILGPLALSLAGWFTFFYMIWGSPLPSAPYGVDPQMNPLTLLVGGPGVWFDQEFGIVTYAPVLLLGFVGLAGMWRGRSTRVFAVELALIGLALLAAVGSFDLWWGGTSMPGRGMMSMLPLFAAPIAWHYHRANAHLGRRAAMQLLLLVSLTITLTMAVAMGGRLAGQNRDGTSPLLEWLSPAWDLWISAPTYIFSNPLTASAQALLWLGGAALVAWFSRRSASATPGRAALRAVSASALVCLAVASVVRAVPGAEQQARFDPQSRLVFPLLVDFDAAARPTGVRYDPFSIVAPSSIPPLFSLTAVPGQRVVPQVRPLLLNARFALPAGEYEIELTGADQSENISSAVLSLQIGREGSPLRTWPMTLSPGRPWRQRFTLPLDSEFVGFVVTPEVEEAVVELRLRPVSIVDAGRRFSTDAILSAVSWGQVTVFFHDSDFYTEPGGFWVRGERTVRATVMKHADDTGDVTLRVHTGANVNTATFATPYWSEDIDLAPYITQPVSVPTMPGNRFVPLRITSATGFIPAEVDAESTDRRRLGVWVEFSQ